MSESVYGTTVSKNLVRESNQRCMVIHGSHNVTLTENVAFDTFGHCYMLEDGGEWENWFIRNLAVQAKVPATRISINGVLESDNQPTQFWMSTPVNHFVGNVAAGSARFGFWIEIINPTRGPSAELAINKKSNGSPVNIQTAPMGIFEGNVAHGCGGNGVAFYPKAYRPSETAVPKDTMSYKNSGFGFRIGGSVNIQLDGGVMADNMNGGVETSGAIRGAVLGIANMTVAGVTDHLDMLIQMRDAAGFTVSRPCHIKGIDYPANKVRENWCMRYGLTNYQYSNTPTSLPLAARQRNHFQEHQLQRI